ncbi:MAG TPA: hypothetical protein VIM77_03390, partial [Mucilaginibacter sp.]
MSKIKLAHIGLADFEGIGTEIKFLCDDYLLDYDFIIASGMAIMEDMNYLQQEMPTDEALACFKKRSNDLKEFYHHGGTLVLLINDSHVCPGFECTPEFNDGKLIDIMSTRPAKINYVTQHGSNVQYHPIVNALTSTVQMNFKAILNHTGPNT